jgi:uncharacterized cysteine cluster protein YcgN (CxxCxxCC family)
MMKKLCTRCTICCYYKTIEDDGSVFYTDRPCEYLDIETGLCIVYECRTEAKKDCVRISRKVVELGALPEGCPYVAGEKNYKGPRLTKKLEKIAREVLGRKGDSS